MPRGTPPEVQKILHDGFKKAIEDPAFVRTADRLVFDLEYQPADETARRLGQPGAGFLPFWVAAALGVMSAILIVRSLRAPPDAPGDTADELDRRGTVGALAGLVLYSLLLEPIGFLPATFLLLTGLARLLAAPGWTAPVVFGALGTGGSYALFDLWLGVPLPEGLLLP